jgi:hypothetical protein
MEELGTGVLDWDREERVSDRYGLVKLFQKPAGTERSLVSLRQVGEKVHGRLIAVIRKARPPSHIGDFFHCILPKPGEVNARVILGEGALFFEDGGVGLLPDDGRDNLWLNITALYEVHNQTVTLFFEGSPVN